MRSAACIRHGCLSMRKGMQLQRLTQVTVWSVAFSATNGDSMAALSPPGYVKHILGKLTDGGHTAYCVGGCVRDAIMGRPVHDWDVATSAPPFDTARMFAKTAMTGERFGTVTVIQPEGPVEVTTYRADGRYNDARRPENVEFLSDIEGDLRRRDFTINAMAASITGEIIDICGGCKDIEDRIIRCVGDPAVRFGEDALRMFRAFRFRAELDFEIEQTTLDAIAENSGKAGSISAERVRVELEKTLMSQKPGTVGEMIGAGLLDKYLANGYLRSSIPSAAFAGLAYLPPEAPLRWCVFCSILQGAGLVCSAADFLRSLKHDGKTIKACTSGPGAGEFPDSVTGVKHMLAKHGALATRCAAAARDAMQAGGQGGGGAVAACHTNDGRLPNLKLVDVVIMSGECFSLKGLCINGSDLIAHGHRPGAGIGRTLEALLSHVIDHPGDNDYNTLLNLADRIVLS